MDKISFTVEAGEVFGFLGHNGAGKTTTIRMLSGQLPLWSVCVVSLVFSFRGATQRRPV